MAEQGDFSELPLNDIHRRAIVECMPLLKAIGDFLECSYLSNDPECEAYVWRQVRAARNNIFSALAWLQEAVGEADQPKNLTTPAGG